MVDKSRDKGLREAGSAYAVAGTVTSTRVRELLDKACSVLSVTDEDIIFRGIAAEVTTRLVELKKAAFHLQQKYESLEHLQQIISREGVPPDDHTLYADLLEWRAIEQEIPELTGVLESL